MQIVQLCSTIVVVPVTLAYLFPASFFRVLSRLSCKYSELRALVLDLRAYRNYLGNYSARRAEIPKEIPVGFDVGL